MRFLHLSDLHLGKRVCEFSMLDDQRYILEQILGQGVSEDAMSAVRGIILTPEIASYLGEDLSQTVSEFLSRITTVPPRTMTACI